MSRTQRFTFLVDEHERRKIADEAALLGVSQSDFVRLSVLGTLPKHFIGQPKAERDARETTDGRA